MTFAPNTPTAADFMNTHVQTIDPQLSLQEIVHFLKQHQLSSVPVVERDAAGRATLLGFISEADCLHYLANGLFHGAPVPNYTAEAIMQKHPIGVPPETELFELISIFESHRLRHLPVLDADKHLLGIVSRRDILHALTDYFDAYQKQADSERTPLDLRQLLNLRFFSK